MITFDQERPCDVTEIDSLLDAAFGPERFKKSSYILRETLCPVQGLSLVARVAGAVVGTVRCYPVQVLDLLSGITENVLLLGPLAVSPNFQGAGVGAELVKRTLSLAKAQGYKRIVLVGDQTYYRRFGFEPVLPRYITLPGGQDARRLLVWQVTTVPALPTVGKLMPGWSGVSTPDNWRSSPLISAA